MELSRILIEPRNYYTLPRVELRPFVRILLENCLLAVPRPPEGGGRVRTATLMGVAPRREIGIQDREGGLVKVSGLNAVALPGPDAMRGLPNSG